MIGSAQLSKEISVTAANKIGVLADIAKMMAEHGINIQAVAGYAVGDEAKIMLVTADNLRATDALKKAGYKSLKENEVIVLELENKAGVLKNVTDKLLAENIDIKQIYGTACVSECPARIILSTADNQKALAVFKK